MEEWKTWAAVWGALTGTVSLLIVLFSKRPRFRWEANDYEGDDRLLLVVENPSQSTLMISRIRAFPAGYGFFPVRHDHSVHSTTRDAYRWHKEQNIPVFINPDETRKIGVNTIKEGSRALIVVFWHRHWLFPLRVPALLWLSRRMTEEINAAAK